MWCTQQLLTCFMDCVSTVTLLPRPYLSCVCLCFPFNLCFVLWQRSMSGMGYSYFFSSSIFALWNRALRPEWLFFFHLRPLERELWLEHFTLAFLPIACSCEINLQNWKWHGKARGKNRRKKLIVQDETCSAQHVLSLPSATSFFA